MGIYLSNPIRVCELWQSVYVCVCLRVPPPLLIEARWCVETVNVFPWISVVGRALIDSDLTALHGLSYSETIAFNPFLSASSHKLLCFLSSSWRWMMRVSRANHKRLAIMSSYYFILISTHPIIQSHSLSCHSLY